MRSSISPPLRAPGCSPARRAAPPRPPAADALNALFRARRRPRAGRCARGCPSCWRRAPPSGSKLEAIAAPRRRLHAAPAGAHRRLHRFLRRHPPRDQRRQAVPPRQSAAAELQVRADRLPRPRLLDRPSGTPVRRPNGQRKPPGAAAPSFGPCRSGSTTSWNSASGSAPATSWAAHPDRRGGRRTSPASAC